MAHDTDLSYVYLSYSITQSYPLVLIRYTLGYTVYPFK